MKMLILVAFSALSAGSSLWMLFKANKELALANVRETDQLRQPALYETASFMFGVVAITLAIISIMTGFSPR